MLSAQTNSRAPRYDLLVRGGRVVDPSQNLFGDQDVAIAPGRIAQVAAGIPENEARQVLNAKGKIVTPGLIDVHVHVHDGVAPLGIPADPNCVVKGVTTVVDAGLKKVTLSSWIRWVQGSPGTRSCYRPPPASQGDYTVRRRSR